jgi:hypothetical protein
MTAKNKGHNNASKMAVENGTYTYPFAFAFSFAITEARP